MLKHLYNLSQFVCHIENNYKLTGQLNSKFFTKRYQIQLSCNNSIIPCNKRQEWSHFWTKLELQNYINNKVKSFENLKLKCQKQNQTSNHGYGFHYEILTYKNCYCDNKFPKLGLVTLYQIENKILIFYPFYFERLVNIFCPIDIANHSKYPSE